jgi:hypothetical protein
MTDNTRFFFPPLYTGDRIHTPIEVFVPYCVTDPVYASDVRV